MYRLYCTIIYELIAVSIYFDKERPLRRQKEKGFILNIKVEHKKISYFSDSVRG